jgi:hypothetical protein
MVTEIDSSKDRRKNKEKVIGEDFSNMIISSDKKRWLVPIKNISVQNGSADSVPNKIEKDRRLPN